MHACVLALSCSTPSGRAVQAAKVTDDFSEARLNQCRISVESVSYSGVDYEAKEGFRKTKNETGNRPSSICVFS